MSSDGVNEGRRRFLIGATSVVGAVGVVGAAVPFVESWNPSAKAKTAGAPVVADISKLEMGQKVTVEWRGKPVFIVRRPKEILAELKKDDAMLRDPNSDESEQPSYCKNMYRARESHSDILVMVGICTHLGCVPLYRPEIGAPDLGKDWPGGYFCPCHGSKYDSSGRVFKDVPAPLNMPIPPYYFISDTLIKIGLDGEKAS